MTRSKRFRSGAFALLLVSGVTTAAHAAKSGFAELDAEIDAAIAHYDLPGIAVGIVERGEVVHVRTAGELVAGEGAPVTRRSLFKIASNTKAMTAATLARLVARGALAWDDPVAKHLPSFRMHDPWVTREMQVRDLLIHDSGLRAGAGDLMLWPAPNAYTRADVLRGLAYLKPIHSFRSTYDYDNSMYIVAGEVAAAAGGAPYDAMVRREVFEPLGLAGCRVGDWDRDGVELAQPHRREDGRKRRWTPPAASAAASTTCSRGRVSGSSLRRATTG
jgi:CubicO group peptidase (beta-lactamase class C family)